MCINFVFLHFKSSSILVKILAVRSLVARCVSRTPTSQVICVLAAVGNQVVEACKFVATCA